MKTEFTAEQLAQPRIAEANSILRKCVHCGFCTATCPTYVLLGDELDSPRGRIYLIKNMLETGEAATAETVKHIDRCLSCLACMTTCPSGVHYMHLVDQARAHIERTYERPPAERLIRAALALVLPYPNRFRAALNLARLGKPLAPLLPRGLAAMLALAPDRLPKSGALGHPGVYPAAGRARARVALLEGCAQSVLMPSINAAAIRLLNRFGIEVAVPREQGCCGALTHHMGREDDALAKARRNIDAWEDDRIEAVIITASGCGTTIKDYGHMLRLDSAYAEKAARVAAKARDITEYLDGLELPATTAPRRLRLAYHSACSLQYGQKITAQPKALLRNAGFEVVDIPEGHLCCGSAGTYNILQPEIAAKLRDRKVRNLEALAPDAVATGNIGCIVQIAAGTAIPILHTVELLDWAHGGPKPEALKGLGPESGPRGSR